MTQYLDLLRLVLAQGKYKADRKASRIAHEYFSSIRQVKRDESKASAC